MHYLTQKKPGDTRLYTVDLSKTLGDDVISLATLTVDTGTVTASQIAWSDQSVSFLLAGGADGVEQLLTLTINTNALQILTESLSLTITDGVQLPYRSTTTKRAIVEMAFEDLGISGYEFNATPEEQFSMLRRLDGLAAEMLGQGTDIGYNAPQTFGEGDLDDASNVPDTIAKALGTLLAVDFAQGLGKAITPDLRIRANVAKNTVYSTVNTIPERQLPLNTVRGQGNRRYRYGYGIWGW